MAKLVMASVRSLHHNISCEKLIFNALKNVRLISNDCAEALPQASAVNKPDLNISDECVKKLQEIAEEGCFLRITVEGGGCAGFQYKFSLDKDTNNDDRMFSKDGAKIVIDETSLEYVKGSTIDYHSELIRSAFRIINNPMAEQGCSCGASFTIKI